MTAEAEKVLSAASTLSETEWESVLHQLLIRRPAGGEIPVAALEELADELFRTYDAAEQSDAPAAR